MKIGRQLLRNFIAVVEDPTRTDLVFKAITSPEVLNDKSIATFLKVMNSVPAGAAMVRERYEKPWKVGELAEYPKGSLGQAYARHMIDNGLDADFFDKVPGDSESAYVQMRFRRTHDIWHAITGFDTSVAGEAGLQGFQIAQIPTRSSAVIMSMFLMNGVIFNPEELQSTTAAIARGWTMGKAAKPLFAERFEEMWERNLHEYRQELGLSAYF